MTPEEVFAKACQERFENLAEDYKMLFLDGLKTAATNRFVQKSIQDRYSILGFPPELGTILAVSEQAMLMTIARRDVTRDFRELGIAEDETRTKIEQSFDLSKI